MGVYLIYRKRRSRRSSAHRTRLLYLLKNNHSNDEVIVALHNEALACPYCSSKVDNASFDLYRQDKLAQLERERSPLYPVLKYLPIKIG